MKKITTVLFDLDGTLLDTLDDLVASVNYALETNHLPQRSKLEVRRMLGNGVRALMKAAVPADLSSTDFESVFDCFRSYYMEHSLNTTRPYDGIPELLEALKRRHYKIGIVSNKMDEAVQELNQKFFSGYVDVAVGESPTIHRKPASDGIMFALNSFGSRLDEAVYVGDSEVDLETARNAHITCLSATWGFRDTTYLLAQGADHLVTVPSDILQFVEQGRELL